MSDYTPSLATAREVFIEGAQGEFVGEDFDRMIAQVRAEELRAAHADLQAYTDAGAPLGHRPIEEFLLRRADRIEKEAGL